jgi:hypothetical protein
MKWCTISAAMFMLAALAASGALAAKRLSSKAELEEGATHIIVGKVRSIISTEHVAPNWLTTTYFANVSIDKIEKGQGLKVGGIVQLRYMHLSWQGAGSPPPHDSGHSPTPKNDDFVRVYLVNNGYNGAGYTKDGGYDVYYKNGFEILVQPAR